MAKRRMSADARRRISEAQRRRWAAVRAGKTYVRKQTRGAAQQPGMNGNPYLRMTVSELVSAKRQLDEAWGVAAKALRRG